MAKINFKEIPDLRITRGDVISQFPQIGSEWTRLAKMQPEEGQRSLRDTLGQERIQEVELLIRRLKDPDGQNFVSTVARNMGTGQNKLLRQATKGQLALTCDRLLASSANIGETRIMVMGKPVQVNLGDIGTALLIELNTLAKNS